MRVSKQLLSFFVSLGLVTAIFAADQPRRFQRLNGYRPSADQLKKVAFQEEAMPESSEDAMESVPEPAPAAATAGSVHELTHPPATNHPQEIIIEHAGQPTPTALHHPSGSAGCDSCSDCSSAHGLNVQSNGCTGCDDCLGRPHGYKYQLRKGLGLDHLSFFGGVHGFKNQTTRGEAGSFGFREGLNFGTFGRGIVLPPSFGYQIGFSASQTDISGASFTDSQRNQTFLTAGMYRRGDRGLQGGVVFDYLKDDWYFDDLGVSQIRGEISIAISDRQSYGLWFASALADDTQTSALSTGDVVETWETEDLYAFFYRSRMLAEGAGEMRLFAGWTGDNDALIGANTKLPLQNGFAIETDFTYLLPDEDRGSGGHGNEAWNVGINLAWYPGSLAKTGRRYHRPMFDVANNGSMILRQKQ